jgi:SAM-dependent methyltransferase
MIEIARERAGADGVTFLASSFESLEAPPGTFGLIIAGAALHWIDPEVRFRKAARLLRPGGWLAVAGYEERYEEPVGSALDGMWQARSADNGAWVTRPADDAAISGSGLFGRPAHRTFTRRLTRSAADAIGVENTRATSLSWPDDVRSEFSAELGRLLSRQDPVGVTVSSSVIMAPVLTAAAHA